MALILAYGSLQAEVDECPNAAPDHTKVQTLCFIEPVAGEGRRGLTILSFLTAFPRQLLYDLRVG